MSNNTYQVVFNQLPTSLEELKALSEASLTQPHYAAALLIPVLKLWPHNKDEAISMMNFLRGPDPLSTYAIQFISERLKGNEYIPDSYFLGSSPQNSYEPQKPYTVVVYTMPNSFSEQGYAQFSLQSSGADSPRPVKLRNKPSTGQWFITDQMLLAQIRVPVSSDPWA